MALVAPVQIFVADVVYMQLERLFLPLLQHLERRPQWCPQPKARAAERDGDDGLERIGEAVEDHAQPARRGSARRAGPSPQPQ